jgi:hypothetical protein
MYLLSTNAICTYYSALPFPLLLCRLLAWRTLTYWLRGELGASARCGMGFGAMWVMLVSLAAHVRKYSCHVRSSFCLAACLEGKYVV